MGKHISVQIGPYYFPTKKAAKEHAKEILNSYPCGETIPEPHESFLRDLLGLHHRAADKIGGGADHFIVEREDVWGTKHFSIVYSDGSKDDFSYIKCIDGANFVSEVREAMRSAVAEQVLDFKKRRFSEGVVLCPFTQEALRPETSHVDHVAPNTFYEILNEWLTSAGLTLEEIAISLPRAEQVRRDMTDETQIQSWTSFHRAKAKLRLTSKLGNLSHAKKNT
jgi:hypothetical protein